MYWAQTFNFDSVYSIDTREKRRVIVLKMIEKGLGDRGHKEFFLLIGHCFDNEALIGAKKEERA